MTSAARLERRIREALEDLRLAAESLGEVVDRAGDGAWDSPMGRRFTLGETLVHSVLLLAIAQRKLRDGDGAGGERGASAGERVRRALVFSTWRLPDSWCADPSLAPHVIPGPREARGLLLSVTAESAGMLRARRVAEPALRVIHPALGPMDLPDWCRLHRIHVEHHRAGIEAALGAARRAR